MERFRSGTLSYVIRVIALLAFLADLGTFPRLTASSTSSSQPHHMGVSGMGSQDMVNKFTGDFSYSIPLFEMGGYPLTLNYNSNVKMEHDAGWVGFGWTVNPGSINRSKRGIPDDYKHDTLYEVTTKKTKEVYGSRESETMKLPLLTFNASSTSGDGTGTNNYWGGYSEDFFSMNASIMQTMQFAGHGTTRNYGIGFSYFDNSRLGLNVGLSTTMNYTRSIQTPMIPLGSLNKLQKRTDITKSVTTSHNYNSRSGYTSRLTLHEKQQENFQYGFFDFSYNSFAFNASASTVSYLNTYRSKPLTYSTTGVVTSGTSSKHKTNKMLFLGASSTEHYSDVSALDRSKYHRLNGYFYNTKSNWAELSHEHYYDQSFDSDYLPLPNQNHDVFYYSSPFSNGAFRGFKRNAVEYENNDVLGRENKVEKTITSYEETFGERVHGMGSYIDRQKSGNFNIRRLFETTEENIDLRLLGGHSKISPSFYDKIGGDRRALRRDLPAKLVKKDFLWFTYKTLEGSLDSLYNVMRFGRSIDQLSREALSDSISRADQNTTIRKYTNAEVTTYLSNSTIDSYDLLDSNKTWDYSKWTINRTGAGRKPHHIGQVSITNEQGARMDYGLPVYSYVEKEVNFALGDGGIDYDCETGIATYNNGSGTDNSTSNQGGRDNHYSERTFSPYPTDFLITDYFSGDYIDRTADGPTEDDFGDYVHFNYTRVSDKFRWRNPYSPDEDNPTCYYQEGKHQSDKDDRGYYQYGEKELWYIQSMVSKNRVAEFHLKKRKDGYPVKGENGETDQSVMHPQYCLKRIVIYNKEERDQLGDDAVPVKRVHFKYDYSLCSKLPSHKDYNTSTESGPGKLTLKEVHFYYGNSEKSYDSFYSFDYTGNYHYHKGSIDHWGNYMRDHAFACEENNIDYPYLTRQDSSDINLWAGAWKLSEITTPQGSKIEIDYEADQYSYVQDQLARKLIEVVSLESDLAEFNQFDVKNELYQVDVPIMLFSNLLLSMIIDQKVEGTPRNYLIFELDEPLSGPDAVKTFHNSYFRDHDLGRSISFHGKIDLFNNGEYEDIELDLEIEEVGLVNSEYGYIKVKHSTMDDDHSFSGSRIADYGFQLCRTTFADLAADGDWEIDNGFSVTRGFDINRNFMDERFCQEIDLERSYVQLNVPGRAKYGGGARVKSIKVTDNWDEMTGDDSFTYGQEYTYETWNGKCSGVASFEPSFGGKESPLKHYTGDAFPAVVEKIKKYPDNHYFKKSAIGNSYFSAPVVGYSSVFVKNISHQDVTVNTTGKTHYEFYTTNDFPIKIEYTDQYRDDLTITNRHEYDDKKYFSEDFSIPEKKIRTRSQGYLIVQNDMHGKPRQVVHYDRDDNVSSAIQFKYKASGDDLENEVRVIDKNGKFKEEIHKVELDVVSDFQRHTKRMQHNNANYHDIKVGKKLYTLFGATEYTNEYNEYSKDETYTNVVVKHLKKYGILEEVKVWNGTSLIKNQFLAYDASTGIPLLSRKDNEFYDKEYEFNYPAYWAYPALGKSSQNQDLKLGNVNFSGGELNISNAANLFNVGDQIALANGELGWVVEVNTSSIKAIDSDGDYLSTGNTSLIIVKSGNKNQLTSEAGSTRFLGYPLGGGQLSFSNILESAVVEYKDKWNFGCREQSNCGYESVYNCALDPGGGEDTICSSTTVPLIGVGDFCDSLYDHTENPYLTAQYGQWRPHKKYVYRTTRKAGLASLGTNIRDDGTYENYVPFWDLPNSVSGTLHPIHSTSHSSHNPSDTLENWSLVGEILDYNQNGVPVQSQDVEQKTHAVLMGYNHVNPEFPSAVVSNASLSEVGYDGAEDYLYRMDNYSCEVQGHWNFKVGLDEDYRGIYLDDSEAHTGKYSIALEDGARHTMSRIIKECSSSSTYGEAGFIPGSCQCLASFAPSPGTYVIGAWIKEQHAEPASTYSGARMKVIQKSPSGTVVENNIYRASGPMVEGWQRLEGEVEISEDTYCIEFTLENFNDSEVTANFDDLRFHPKTASLKSIVVDPIKNRPTAYLDTYNFFLKVEYDREEKPVRLKKETYQGIKTISEHRSSLHKR